MGISLKESQVAKAQHRERKKIVVAYYSQYKMACIRCGFSDMRALSIDHIDGGGARHIKQIKGNFYSWLITNNFPPGFQVLCMNCQWIKRAENNETAKKRPRQVHKWEGSATPVILSKEYWESSTGKQNLITIRKIQQTLFT